MSARFHNLPVPTKVVFGSGCRAELAVLLEGRDVLIVTTGHGRRRFLGDSVLTGLVRGRLSWADSILPNPTLTAMEHEIDRWSGSSFDAVVGFGGGSAIDAAKVLAAALGNDTRDLPAMIAQPQSEPTGRRIPLYALPTTAGTGSEVTPFATIWDHTSKTKLSLTGAHIFPHTALVDPDLTFGVPTEAAISCGLDALNQAFESVWNRHRSATSTASAARSVRLSLRALPRTISEPGDREARENMAEASLLAGLCIAQTRTSLCHAMSYPLTAHLGVPHGLACAFFMRAVAGVCTADAPGGLADLAIASGYQTTDRLLEALDEVLESVQFRRLTAAVREKPDAVLALLPEMSRSCRAENFMLPVSEALLQRIVERSL